MKLRFAPRAVSDIIEIGNYLRERSPSAALRVREAIFDCLRNLISYPYVGHLQAAAQDVRKLVVRQYPYVIYYTIDATNEDVIVLAVKHAAREREHEDA